ncbi:MAG: polyprenyl synthetase family protein [Patescibacteria group bacterium]
MFDEHSEKIRQRLVAILDETLDAWVAESRFPIDHTLLPMLKSMSTKGKLFRGTLLVQSYQLLTGTSSADVKAQHTIESAYQTAAAVELYGTALLIHDDIMDRATERRGAATVDVQIADFSRENDLHEPAHVGQSTAICAGDFLFFVAQQMLSQLSISTEVAQRIQAVSAHELALLGLAQIEDLRQASLKTTPSQDQVLAMYAGKTGRYTGRWPLELAAVLAELDAKQQAQLGQIGEQLGVLYQLQDDYLGLFGDETVLGKSVTSDLTEGKKTLLYSAYFTSSDCDHAMLEKVFGIADASKHDITQVKKSMQSSGVVEQVRAIMSEMQQATQSHIEQLHHSAELQQFLKKVLTFIVQREK